MRTDIRHRHHHRTSAHYAARLRTAASGSPQAGAVFVRRRLAAGEDPREPDPLPKRHATVEQVARELYDMLLYTGSDNPVVEDIRQELSQELGREVHFTYPPDGSLCILGQGPDGTGALTPEQQRAARHALWRITRRRVDKGVLRPAPGFCPGHSGAE